MEIFGNFLTSKNEIDFFSKNLEESDMTSIKNEIDFFSKNSEESDMTSNKKQIDFFSKNPINKRDICKVWKLYKRKHFKKKNE